VAAIAGVNPASITNGATAHTSTGSTTAQIISDLSTMMSLLSTWNSPFWVMSPSTAAFLASRLTSGGSIAFPNITARGGTLYGIDVLTSINTSGLIVLLDAASIMYARGAIEIDRSTQASVEMDSAPAAGESSPVSAISTLKSFFQNDLIGIRAEQEVSYLRSSNTGVVYMTVAY
jgi:hypothetical protein